MQQPRWWDALIALLGIVAAWIAVASFPASCPAFEYVGVFAGNEERLADRLAGCPNLTITEARWAAVVLALAALLTGIGLWFLLRRWWSEGWRAEPFKRWERVPRLGAGGAAAGAITGLVLLAAVQQESGSVTLREFGYWFLPVFGWPTLLGLALAAVLWVFALAGSLGSRNTPKPTEVSLGTPWQPPDRLAGIGVSCSGGGIRAGSVALGALSELETRNSSGGKAGWSFKSGLLYNSAFLASVSGGGYIAGAWRIAAGTHDSSIRAEQTWPEGILGIPDYRPVDRKFDDPPRSDTDVPNLYRYALERRRFLTTGRGGMTASGARLAVGILIQIVLIAWFIFLIAWPLGRAAASWAIMGDEVGTTVDLNWRLYGPVVVWGGVALGVFLLRSRVYRTRARATVEISAAVLVALAVVLSTLLLLVPTVIWLFTQLGIGGISVVVTAAAGTAIGSVVVPLVAEALKPRAVYFGGVLLAFAVLLFGAIVMREAALADSGALFGETVGEPAWAWYVVALIGFFFAWSLLDPHRWSLNSIYHARLRDAFATTTDKDAAPEGHPWRKATAEAKFYPVAPKSEPLLSEYAEAWGPELLVCTSVARETKTATGIPALSFVLSPTTTSLYDVQQPTDASRGKPVVMVHELPTSEYLEGFTREQRQREFGTISAATAMSGAAVAPAMGRFNLGTTNSLLAALNIRLGAWMPNPRYSIGANPKYKPTRLNYLLKEVFGWFDLEEPFLYTADGGHRENLGLVELLRKRCSLIFCIDASGDQPGEFTTLLEALRLAEVECGAVVGNRSRFTADLKRLRPSAPGEWPETCALSIPIKYKEADGTVRLHLSDLDDSLPEDRSATLIYMKALVDRDAPVELKAFSHEDPCFPDFSTGNQFLSESQFRNLVLLGQHMVEQGLKKLDDPIQIEAGVGLSTVRREQQE